MPARRRSSRRRPRRAGRRARSSPRGRRGRVSGPSERARASKGNRSSSRTVMSQRSLTNASISVSSSAPASVSTRTAWQDEEQVRGIAVELRALVRPESVLDGQLVQAELVGELVELRDRGAAEVHPHHGVRLSEVLRDVGDGEALGVKHTLAVHPGRGITHCCSSMFTAVTLEANECPRLAGSSRGVRIHRPHAALRPARRVAMPAAAGPHAGERRGPGGSGWPEAKAIDHYGRFAPGGRRGRRSPPHPGEGSGRRSRHLERRPSFLKDPDPICGDDRGMH